MLLQLLLWLMLMLMILTTMTPTRTANQEPVTNALTAETHIPQLI